MSVAHNRQAVVYFGDIPAGRIEELSGGYCFTYYTAYLDKGSPLSLSLPLRAESFDSEELHPFFLGLLPEGWYREVVCRTMKIDEHDDFGLLIATCGDCIGSVSVQGA